MRINTLLTCGKYLHDRIISLICEVCVHKTRLTRHFYWLSVPGKWASCMCLVEVYILSLFLHFSDWVSELIWRYSIFCLHFISLVVSLILHIYSGWPSGSRIPQREFFVLMLYIGFYCGWKKKAKPNEQYEKDLYCHPSTWW